MGSNTKIEWTDASWTPVRARNLKTGKVGWHCEHATTGCEFCYAETLNKRLGTGLPFKPGHRSDIEIFLDDKMLLAPLRWKKPRMIFVCSMTDLFADFVPDEWIDKVFAVMALCPQHTFQVLTKRAERMRDYLTAGTTVARSEIRNHLAWNTTIEVMREWCPDWIKERPDGPNRSRAINAFTKWPLPNVWLGVSTERQKEADERIPLLLQTPAAVRFISAEPLLGPIDLTNHEPHGDAHGWSSIWKDNAIGRPWLDWVISGGESGPNARPSHPQWYRDIRDACAAAGVAYFHKQWGSWKPLDQFSERIIDGAGVHAVIDLDGRYVIDTDIADPPKRVFTFKMKKGAAGRLLDGITHDAMPSTKDHVITKSARRAGGLE